MNALRKHDFGLIRRKMWVSMGLEFGSSASENSALEMNAAPYNKLSSTLSPRFRYFHFLAIPIGKVETVSLLSYEIEW